jgi:transcriptional regulator with XRE-family HTH domain
MKINRNLSQRIKSLRRTQSLSQAQMAEKLQLSLRYFQKIESGHGDVKLSLLQKLSDSLGLDPHHLIAPFGEFELTTMNLHSSQNLLDLIPAGVLVQDLKGRMLFANKFIQLLWRIDYFDPSQRDYYTWDYFQSAERVVQLKNYNEYLIQNHPDPTPHFTDWKLPDGTHVKIRIDWHYLFGKNILEQKELKGFLSVFSVNQDQTSAQQFMEKLRR